MQEMEHATNVCTHSTSWVTTYKKLAHLARYLYYSIYMRDLDNTRDLYHSHKTCTTNTDLHSTARKIFEQHMTRV